MAATSVRLARLYRDTVLPQARLALESHPHFRIVRQVLRQIDSSAEQGVGCDNTTGPHIDLRPAVATIPGTTR